MQTILLEGVWFDGARTKADPPPENPKQRRRIGHWIEDVAEIPAAKPVLAKVFMLLNSDVCGSVQVCKIEWINRLCIYEREPGI